MTRRKPKAKRNAGIQGSLSAKGLRFGVVVSRFNEFLTSRLLESVVDALRQCGAREKDICVVHVPGAFEIPLALKKLLKGRKLDAVITLAVVIRGQTRHFEQVADEAAKGVREVSLHTETPVILGMIPAENQAQAVSRVGVKQVSKGREWALAAVEMANLMRRLPSKRSRG